MPPWQDAISALAPIVGGAGLSGVVIAILGFLVSSRRGGRPSGEQPSVSGIIVGAEDVKLIAHALNRCADTLERAVKAAHEVADIARVVVVEARGARDEMERNRRED